MLKELTCHKVHPFKGHFSGVQCIPQGHVAITTIRILEHSHQSWEMIYPILRLTVHGNHEYTVLLHTSPILGKSHQQNYKLYGFLSSVLLKFSPCFQGTPTLQHPLTFGSFKTFFNLSERQSQKEEMSVAAGWGRGGDIKRERVRERCPLSFK